MVRCRSILGALLSCLSLISGSRAADHLDSPTVIADPRADIGDLYAWMSADTSRLNLALTIVGHGFAPDIAYEFHIGSGTRFGETARSISVYCRFPKPDAGDCRLGGDDRAQGRAGDAAGIVSGHERFRMFAGLRDDPFFNNVRGTRDAYRVAQAALGAGATVDKDRCPAFVGATVAAIRERWRQVDGGPATNFLKGWTPASIVLSIDVASINAGGPILSVWAATRGADRQIDRMGRPLTGNALLGTLDPADQANVMKEAYNAADPAHWPDFAAEIARNLGLYDGFDGVCGNALLTGGAAPAGRRYDRLAAFLADDRLWINSASGQCRHFAAVELTALAGRADRAGDCGGRSPGQDAVDIYRSLLSTGLETGIDDGVDGDEKPPSETVFPFLAPP
ncbi:MAG: DUF4331 family protein [Niveispirillum sp.]|uniref:DUF4331 family protein n=1 Tax=Niveispirillum sp. TaxID=1917217 RepID=UPI004035059A